MNAKQIREGHDRLTTELRSLDRSNPSNLEDFLQRYATVLPESNQLSREVQYGLLQLYKSVPDLPTHHLLKKSLVCKSLLDLADKIEPGLTKFRGEILFELQSTSVLLAQKAMEDGKMERYQAMVNRNSNFTSVLQYVLFSFAFQEIFEENIHRLREAITILQIEPDGKEQLQNEMEKLSKLLSSDEE